MGQVLSWSQALEKRDAWKREGRSVVFTNGHFDILHLGHVDYLGRARSLGDILVVGLNGDASTRQLKGPGRPIVPAMERAAILAALRSVDGVVIFDTPTAEDLVRALAPEVYVKGGDWSPDEGRRPPEAEIVWAAGGRVEFIPYLPGHSTTAIIRTILDRYGQRE